MDNYRPQLFLRTADITVGLHWPEGTPDAADKMVMPGDNVEMVCDLVHDAAAEVGTRFTLREGGKTSKYSYHITPTCGSHRYPQLELVLSQSFLRWFKPLVSYRSPLCFIPSVIRARARYKSCCRLPPLMLSSLVLCHSLLMKSRNIASRAYVHSLHTLRLAPVTYALLAMRSPVLPGIPS